MNFFITNREIINKAGSESICEDDREGTLQVQAFFRYLDLMTAFSTKKLIS